MISREVGVALIGLASVVATATLGPAIRGWLQRVANGRLQSAKERQDFYRDIKRRLAAVEAELATERDKNLQLGRRIVQVEELAADIENLREIVQEHLSEHPKFETLMALTETMTIRMGRGIA